MPIKIQKDLPAKAILESENIFVMDEDRAMSQDIRPLEILILNLMPIKEDTETQLLRALSNTPLQVVLHKQVQGYLGIRLKRKYSRKKQHKYKLGFHRNNNYCIVEILSVNDIEFGFVSGNSTISPSFV